MSRRLRPFFKYYGAKHRLAPQYPAPEYQTIVEPFAGSASYATLHHTKNVILAEVDADIATLWRWLIQAHSEEIRELPIDVPPGTDIRHLSISTGAQLLIRAWQRVGRSDCWTISKWNNANSGFWHERTRDAIADQVSAIRHWQIVHGSVLDQQPSTPATWFVDPPYQSQPDVYGGKGSGPDFPALSRWCRALPGQVIVCEAPGATWLPFRELALNTVGRTKQGGTRPKRMEMVWP